MVVEFVLDGVEDGFLVLVNLVPDGLTFVKGEFLHFDTQTCVLLFLRSGCLLDVRADICDALAELIYGELLNLRLKSLDFLHDGFDFLKVSGRLVTENLGEE